MSAVPLPSGTVAFAFTDVEGSTGHLRALGDRWRGLLDTVQAVIRSAVDGTGGVVVGTEGDGALLAFPDVQTAVRALVAAQQALLAHAWPADAPVRVRAGVHAGHAEPVGQSYVALAVHEAARVGAVAHGGQLVLSEQAALLLSGALPEGAQLRDRGRYVLRDFPLPVRLHDVTAPGLPPVERGLRAVPADGGNLPAAQRVLHGRDDVVAGLLDGSALTTVVGPPGVGKSATALAAARAAQADDGVWLVPLEALPQLRSVAEAALAALGLPMTGGEEPVGVQLAGRHALLLLDGADDRTAEVAALADSVARRAPGVRLLVTARSPLQVPGERVVRLDPLPVPEAGQPPEVVLASPSVRVLVSGAGQLWDDVRHADALAGLAARTEGLPLALELVGARLGALSPADLLPRADAQLARAGRSGGLRAALDGAWSSVPEPARALWERLSVFHGAVDLDAVEQVCADDDVMPEDEVVDALAALVAGSVVQVQQDAAASGSVAGATRYRLLTSIRQYGAERLELAGQTEALADRHADWAAAAAERWVLQAEAEPPPAAMVALAAAQDDLVVGLGRLGRLEPERVLVLLPPLRRHLRDSLDLPDLLALAEGLSDTPSRAAVVAALRAQLSWERTPGRDTLTLFEAAADVADTAPAVVRVEVLAQLVLAREQFVLPADPVRDDALQRAGDEAGRPGLRVRALAQRAHSGSPQDQALRDSAVELARTAAPGLLPWATGRRLHLWQGDRPAQARADVDGLLLAAPSLAAGDTTALFLICALALLPLGEPDRAGRLAEQALAVATRRRNVVLGFHARALRAAAAGALSVPEALAKLADVEALGEELGWSDPTMTALARGWALAGSDRGAAREWAADFPGDATHLGWQLRALRAAIVDPRWEPRLGLLGHLSPD